MTNELRTKIESHIDAVEEVHSAPTGMRNDGPPQLAIHHDRSLGNGTLMRRVKQVIKREIDQSAVVLFEEDPESTRLSALVWTHPVATHLHQAAVDEGATAVSMDWPISKAKLEFETFDKNGIDYTEAPPLSITVEANPDDYSTIVETMRNKLAQGCHPWQIEEVTADTELSVEVWPSK